MSDINEKQVIRVKLAELEADIAFFDARISLIGEQPPTAYARAQRKLYIMLIECFNYQLKVIHKARKNLYDKKKS